MADKLLSNTEIASIIVAFVILINNPRGREVVALEGVEIENYEGFWEQRGYSNIGNLGEGYYG